MTEFLHLTAPLWAEEDILNKSFADNMVIVEDGKGRRIDNSRFYCGEKIGRPVNSLGCLQAKNETDLLISRSAFLWSIDELLDVLDCRGHVRIRYCIFAEALHDSLHEKGPHSMGMILGMQTGGHLTMELCLVAMNATRNPKTGGRAGEGSFHIVNNVFYGWGKKLGDGKIPMCGYSDSLPHKVNLMHNYYIEGPDTEYAEGYGGVVFAAGSGCHVFSEGNLRADRHGYETDVVGVMNRILMAPTPHPMPSVTSRGMLCARAAYEKVMRLAGTRPRDEEQKRIVELVKNRTGITRDHAVVE